MRSQGYAPDDVKDCSRTAMITEFEKLLPLRKITLVEFERRLKKLVSPEMGDCCTVRMVMECFCDHWAFKDIMDETSLTYDVMFDEMFMMEKEEEDFGHEEDSFKDR
eukprot:CAMPEP_0116880960 /NCGR_PEP_ID=MMETSP0463-20121206/13003_1 /TAXON_ID=181622 /ORGANISM="Strombidinopsis sp, Strain SopsisLIS2011" /LENGTH=106 /DNA_ID=CAMNT_0004532289 /DNA_START=181 /DNA_END=501 /DNA_ORIENTATION=+